MTAMTFFAQAKDKSGANSSSYPAHGTMINAGVGVSNWGLPIFAGVDFFVSDMVSAGAIAGFSVKKQNIGTYSGKYTLMGGGVRGNYHIGKRWKNTPKNTDLYLGLNLGYYSLSYKDNNGNKLTGAGIVNSVLALGAQVGARYYFSKNLAGLAEIGGGAGISGLRLGITYQL